MNPTCRAPYAVPHLLALSLGIPLGFQEARADELRYNDGDVVQGKVISIEEGTIRFQSPRFGELTVPTSQAQVKQDTHPKQSLATDTANTDSTATDAATGGVSAANSQDAIDNQGARDKYSASGNQNANAESGKTIQENSQAATSALPQQQQTDATPATAPAGDRKSAVNTHWWEPWKGRFSVSTELIRKDHDERDTKIEFRLERRWKNDEFRFEPNYEFKRSKGETTTDILKVRTYWRHDFPHRLFSLYAPYVEEDRSYKFMGIPFDYLLIQQQVGGGVRVIEHDKSVLRLGVAENHFYVKLLNYDDISSEIWAESIFAEAELKLPYGISIRERGQQFFYHDSNNNGWTNTFEINKDLAEHIVLTLKHEYRKNAPEIHGDDYSKFRLLLGVDF